MLRSVFSNWTLNAIQIAVFMVLTPFTFGALGTEAFGIWEVIVSTAAPLQLLALGLPMATVRAVSGSLDGDDPDAAGRAAGTAFSMTLILGLVAAAIGAAVRVVTVRDLGPAVLIVANKVTGFICRQGRLSCAGQTKE